MELNISDLHAAYEKDILILQGIDLQAKEGQITIVIGPNGSGKSTILKCIVGFLHPQKGTITIDDHDITGIDPSNILKSGISYVAQGRSVFPYMSVKENLELGCWVFRKDKKRVKERINIVIERFPSLKEKFNEPAGSLSGGQQRILDIAKALLAYPSIILVYEPSVGLSTIFAQDIYDELNKLRDEGRSILLIDQDVVSAMEYADSVYVLELGRVKTQGTRKDFEGQLGDMVREWLV